MSEFVDNLEAVFVAFGPIRVRRMFGGYGVYHDDLMFGLVADDVLYLKADAASADAFVERGLAQFQYAKGGKTVRLSYYQAPEELFDNPGQAKAWAGVAFDAALRGRRPAGKARRKGS